MVPADGDRPDRRTVLGFAAMAAALAAATHACASENISDWVATDHARVRLIDAGPDGAARQTGLQIELDPGFLTYWRTPGEAGVPPTLSFEGSRNLKSATPSYPAPDRFDEGGSDAFGYKDGVVFPIAVVPADPKAPVLLAVALSFAVCSDLCLPAAAHVQLMLDGKGDLPEAGLVADARRRVPVPTPLAGAGPLSVLSITSEAGGKTAQVFVRAPEGAHPVLFIETADPWYIRCGPGEAVGHGQFQFTLTVLSGAKSPARIPATLTLVTAVAAIETAVQLDAVAPTP